MEAARWGVAVRLSWLKEANAVEMVKLVLEYDGMKTVQYFFFALTLFVNVADFDDLSAAHCRSAPRETKATLLGWRRSGLTNNLGIDNHSVLPNKPPLIMSDLVCSQADAFFLAH